MCGIAGFTGRKNNKLLLKMLKSIKYRGPDEKIMFSDSEINAGMNRLSIIDLRKNLYPMNYKNLTLLYNGEIYNFKLLKKRLQEKGIKFKTRSDAEVILPLFDLHGPKAFSMLEGMFAIFIYGKKNKKIYLARDRTGEKPLYFYQQGSFFAFASELKALLLLPELKKSLNPNSLASYLFQGHVFAPKTIIKKIKKIPPAQYLELDLKNKSFKLAPYWSNLKIKSRVNKKNEVSLVKKLDSLIHCSVKKRLMADVPLGCFLSGGVDSSLITYFASKHIKNLHTYSISFSQFPQFDETKYARLASNICQSKHTVISCTARKILPIINNIGSVVDEPIIDAAILPLYLLAQRAREDIKVILTGDGGDELFAGYQRYQKELLQEKARNLFQLIPFSFLTLKKIFPQRFTLLSTPIKKHYSSQRLWDNKMLKNLLVPSKNYYFQKRIKTNIKDSLLFMQKTDLAGFLAEQLLMKTDKATMSHSLETRLPYLDSQIIKFALELPSQYKSNKIQGKYLLKRVAEQYFPKKLVWRKKHGFSVPLYYWFRKDLKDVVWDSLKELKQFPKVFNWKYYQFMVQQHMDETKNWADQIWGIIVLTKFLKYHRFPI